MVKRGWQFDIIQRANYLSGILGSWDVVLVTRSFPRLDQLSKICPKMWMMRLATWNGWFVGMMSRTGRGNTKKHMLPKDTFCTSDICCMVFPSILVALVWYLLVVLAANPHAKSSPFRSSSLAPSSWVQGSCCVELLWWKWEKWIRWRTSKIRSLEKLVILDHHPRTRIFTWHGKKEPTMVM